MASRPRKPYGPGQRVVRDRWGEPLDPAPGGLRPAALDRARLWLMDRTSGSRGLFDRLAALYARHGAEHYGEGVSQREHALQAALLARAAGADSATVTAALLHDIGHLLQRRGTDAAARGIDTRHEAIAAGWLARHFGPAVSEPVRLHVAAKRYLCAVEPGYFGMLSEASRRSLELQGGPLSPEAAEAFAALPFAREAVMLRRWDEAAKRVGAPVPRFARFRPEVEAALGDPKERRRAAP